MARSHAVAISVAVAALVTALWVRSCDVERLSEPATPLRDGPDRPLRERLHAVRSASAAEDVGQRSDVGAPGGDEPANGPERIESVLVVTVLDGRGRTVPDILVTARSERAGAISTLASLDLELASPPLIGDLLTPKKKEEASRVEPPDRRTDTSGVVRFRCAGPGDVRLRAVSDEWFGQTVVALPKEGGPVEVPLTVSPAFRLSGRVVHEDGSPIPQARVYVSVVLPGLAPRQPRRLELVNTDGEGRFRCRVHPVPDTRILVCYVMGRTLAGYAHRFPARTGRMDDVEIVVPRGIVVRGRCVDEEGRPLSGVRVRGIMPGTGEITFTDGKGRFSMKVPGSGGGLIFFLEGRVQTALRDLHGQTESVEIGDVLIPKGGPLAGVVVTESGAAIAGAEVLIVDPWSLHAAARLKSGAEGEFRSDVIGAGVHYILVRTARAGEPDGLRCWFRFDGFTVGTTDARLTVPPGVWARVEVREVGTGEPLAFRKGVFTLLRDDPSGAMPIHHVFEGDPLSGFDVQFPGQGDYVVEFELPVTGSVDRQRLTVGDGPIEPIVFTPR